MTERREDDERGGSIKDAALGEANALGGGDVEGAGAGPDAQSAGVSDTRGGGPAPGDPDPSVADMGGGDDLGHDSE
jgi:hypothetical protein